MTTAPVVLDKYSLGVGDRFAHQAKAQLAACMRAVERGVTVIPVWNKSNREHLIVGSQPSSTRAAADAAVRELGWTRPYYVDANHINLDTVDRFLESSDFFTIDVAHAIGRPVAQDVAESFLRRHPELASTGALAAASKYLLAVGEAAQIYRRIAESKPSGTFVTEVSMDETDCRANPRRVAVHPGRHRRRGHPGPDHRARNSRAASTRASIMWATWRSSSGNSHADLAVIAYAVERYGLPRNLKLSVHSGSDKFSHLCPPSARPCGSSTPACI